MEPSLKHRYSSAAEALAALKPLDVKRLPKPRLSADRIELVALHPSGRLSDWVSLSNPIPETILTGRWEVAEHASDPGSRGWRSFLDPR